MIADTLLNWDKTELANILADKMADADDLVEAFPSIEKASTIEEDILEDFIQSNWKLILSGFDVEELNEWIEEKDYEEEWERWKNECIEEDQEYAEYTKEPKGEATSRPCRARGGGPFRLRPCGR